MKRFEFFNFLVSRTSFYHAAILAAMIFAIPQAANASENMLNIQQVAHSKVDSCEFVGDVRGFSGWGEPAMGFMGAQRHKAKHQAMRQATRLNATHVVWTQLPKKYGSPYAYGKAYNCDSMQRLAHQKLTKNLH